MKKRNTIEIKRWMLRAGVTVYGMRDVLGFSTHTGVSNTLAGRVDNKKVLGYLLEKGCPQKYLGLPKDMQDQHKRSD